MNFHNSIVDDNFLPNITAALLLALSAFARSLQKDFMVRSLYNLYPQRCETDAEVHGYVGSQHTSFYRTPW
jgi:hypothetical protein